MQQLPQKSMPEDSGDERAQPPTKLPVKPPMVWASSNFSGVVGKGCSKQILLFHSTSSSFSEDGSFSMMWTCDECKYENADGKNRICSMCGTCGIQKKRPSHSKVASLQALDEEDRSASLNMPDEGVVAASPPRTGLLQAVAAASPPRPGLLQSSTQSSMRQIMARRQSSIRDLSLLSPVDDCDEDVLTKSLAQLSIEDIGGWTCTDCTFVNTKEHLMCDVCGREQPSNRGDQKSLLRQTSLRHFFTQSTVFPDDSDDSMPTTLDCNQSQGYLKFAQMATDKEFLESLMEEQLAVLNAAATTRMDDISELRGILEEGQATLRTFETFYADEMIEYNAMVALQAVKAEEIEDEEGEPPHHALVGGRATKPGAQRISPQVLEWHGQQRLLDDRKKQLGDREEEIRQLQTQQQQALARILK